MRFSTTTALFVLDLAIDTRQYLPAKIGLTTQNQFWAFPVCFFFISIQAQKVFFIFINNRQNSGMKYEHLKHVFFSPNKKQNKKKLTWSTFQALINVYRRANGDRIRGRQEEFEHFLRRK